MNFPFHCAHHEVRTCDLNPKYSVWGSPNTTATQSVSVRVKIWGKNHLNGWHFLKISGRSAKCVTMSEWVTNLLVFPKMSKNTPNVWQLAGMYHPAFRCGDWMYLQPCSVEASDTIVEYIKSSWSFSGRIIRQAK